MRKLQTCDGAEVGGWLPQLVQSLEEDSHCYQSARRSDVFRLTPDQHASPQRRVGAWVTRKGGTAILTMSHASPRSI